LPSGAFRRTAIIAASIGLTGVLAYWYFALRTPPIPHRTLRIGYENVPPVQLKTDKGPSGLAIETVNEAARRAGISLQWVETGVSSEESLRRGLVDLWPLMADLPDRRKRVHISRPFLYTSHNLILRPGSVRPDSSTFTGRVGVFKLPLHLRLAQTEFPNAQVIQLPEMRQVVQSVCTGAIDVGFLEDRAALAELRDRPPECGSMALRVESLHEMRLPLGVGSTFECAGAADKLRSEIGELYRDGTLAATMAKYSYYGLDDTWSTYALMEASEHARWMAWGAGILGIILAVTVWQAASLRQRKRSEAALRTSEERFRAIFNQAAVGDAQVALDGQVTMVNDRYCRVLGYSREELIGKHLAERIHPEDCAGVLANRRRLLEGASTSYSAEIRSVRKNGEIAWIKLHESLVRHEEGGPPQCSIAVVEDITERRQTELALQESEKRFRNMADTAPVMIWVADADQRCTFFSQGWLNFTGATMEQAVGNGWTERLHPDSREPCQRNFSGAFATHSSFQTECRLRRADGEYRWVLATGTPRFASHGAFAGYVGSCTDITDVKNAQEEALARQKWEGLGVLAGGIAHDFNNLLGSILATSELVLSELPPGSAAGAGVVSIKNVADRAAEIVRQMMAYSGQEDTVLEPLDLSALVKDMLQLLSVSISKRAQLTIDLPENLPAVLANAAQIRQVVMNLITNASEALGDKEGVISVGLAHVPVSQSRAADKPEVSDKDHVRLTISDTGSGMTEQIRARIFDPFFTTKFAGRGLGLAAVRGIIRDHKGAINVFSLPGQGSRFEVLLPCTQHPVPLRNGRLADVSANRIENAGETVLVVEDEQDLRLAVSKMLRKRGFSVIEASDGHAGVDLFRANSGTVDVVLLDLTLPGRTGREVLEEMRRIRPDVNVIVTTAYSQETALQTIGGKQSWRYLRKPYRIVEVENLLRRDYRQ
jgi:PAS domain S-box-containing protein